MEIGKRQTEMDWSLIVRPPAGPSDRTDQYCAVLGTGQYGMDSVHDGHTNSKGGAGASQDRTGHTEKMWIKLVAAD